MSFRELSNCLQFEQDLFSADMPTSVCAIQGSLLLFDLGTNDGPSLGLWDTLSDGMEFLVNPEPYNEVLALKISSDGLHALAADSSCIDIFGLQRDGRQHNACTATFSGFPGPAQMNANWLDNSRVVSASCHGGSHTIVVQMWDLDSVGYAPIDLFTTESAPSTWGYELLDVSGDLLVMGKRATQYVKLWDVRTGTSVRTLEVPGESVLDNGLWNCCVLDNDQHTAVFHYNSSLYLF